MTTTHKPAGTPDGGQFTAGAHSDNVPSLEAPPANRFAGYEDLFAMDKAASEALRPFLVKDPTPDDEAGAGQVRAEWMERRTQLVNASQRAVYDEYSIALEGQAYTLLSNAAHANLRNIADALREAHPDVDTIELDKDFDDNSPSVHIHAVRDKAGNDLPEDHEAWDAAQDQISLYSSRQLVRFTEKPIKLEEAAAWHPKGGLHVPAPR